MMSEFRITADNPNGLDYDMATDDIVTAGSWIAKIANAGAANIRVSGELAPMTMIEQFQRLYTIK